MIVIGFVRKDNRHTRSWLSCLALAGVTVLAGCATPTTPPTAVQAPSAVIEAKKQAELAPPVVKSFKRKIALGRFTNETRYGKALLGGDLDPLGRQTSSVRLK